MVFKENPFDVRRQILTFKVDPRIERVRYVLIMAVEPDHK